MKDAFTLTEVGQAEPHYAEQLLGKPLWAMLQRIELLSETWVLPDVPRTHAYGRLPGEDEIRAWAIPRTTGYLLHLLMDLWHVGTALEIGTSLGYSSLWMASGLAKSGGHLFTCELLSQKIQIASRHLHAAGLSNVTLIEGDALVTTKRWSTPIDFLFLDADPENYPAYWAHLRPWLARGALLVMDNAVDHDSLTAPFCHIVQRDSDWQSWILPIDHGLLFARRR